MSTQRQQRQRGPYGKAVRVSLTLPEGIVALVDQLGQERTAAGVYPDTRSGVVADLIEGGLAVVNAERQKDGTTPLAWQRTL